MASPKNDRDPKGRVVLNHSTHIPGLIIRRQLTCPVDDN